MSQNLGINEMYLFFRVREAPENFSKKKHFLVFKINHIFVVALIFTFEGNFDCKTSLHFV